jgi:hypothetical protein
MAHRGANGHSLHGRASVAQASSRRRTVSGTECVAGTWRFSREHLRRARRMREMERVFDAEPELAALVADLLDEVDDLRARLRRAGLE